MSSSRTLNLASRWFASVISATFWPSRLRNWIEPAGVNGKNSILPARLIEPTGLINRSAGLGRAGRSELWRVQADWIRAGEATWSQTKQVQQATTVSRETYELWVGGKIQVIDRASSSGWDKRQVSFIRRTHLGWVSFRAARRSDVRTYKGSSCWQAETNALYRLPRLPLGRQLESSTRLIPQASRLKPHRSPVQFLAGSDKRVAVKLAPKLFPASPLSSLRVAARAHVYDPSRFQPSLWDGKFAYKRSGRALCVSPPQEDPRSDGSFCGFSGQNLDILNSVLEPELKSRLSKPHLCSPKWLAAAHRVM